MAFIELKQVIECILSMQQLEVFFEDGTPINIAWASHITMINENRINPHELLDGLNDLHWRIEVRAFHRITTPHDDLIGGIMGMFWE
jgi:hypothetical protein